MANNKREFRKTMTQPIEFVYKIPPNDRAQLLNILEEESKNNENLWKELVVKLKLNIEDIDKNSKAPFRDILDMLDCQAKPITFLLAALYK